ncbi:MAG: acetylxylan esterase [Bacteroidales bacterium]|nr:acetylxylan esterase [Bacteroidales bacterium]MBN2634097.1 acetylxylan esterase [Bacteroidales bacterium]
MRKTGLFFFLLAVFFSATAQKEYDVITDKWLVHSDAPNSLYRHITSLAYQMLDERAERTAYISSPAGWKQRQKEIKETLLDIVGPFPEKSPLNARIVKKIEKEGFRVEHIIFESQPGFRVTSSLFIPEGVRRNRNTPAVIYCSGHSAEGYRSEVYQHVILNLVKKGFIVFAFDPVGQGERLEYFNPEQGKSVIGGPTKEHSYPGSQAFLTGFSQARFMIWDGIRAVDYLLTRPEVDPERIGITGRSGGGTQSACIAAFDERILAAAPENYITNYKRLLQSIGPQDAEQNLFNFLSRGLDHADFLIVRAPKPAMMITTTGDMFSIQGAMETEAEIRRVYESYGMPGNFSRVEDEAAHASTLKNREAMYAFFRKHLNNPGNTDDEEVERLTKEEMQVTATGQISTSTGSETVFSINRKECERLEEILVEKRKDPSVFMPAAAIAAKKLSGYREPRETQKPVFTGRIVRENYTVDRYFVKGEGDYVIPYLLFIPGKSSGNLLVYLHPSGKAAEAGPGGEIEKSVMKGLTVMAPDMPGTGELGPGKLRGDAYFSGVSHNLWYAAMITGRSITGILAGDLVAIVKTARQYHGPFKEVFGITRGTMTPVMLHASAFCNEITKVILADSVKTYYSIAADRFYDPHFIMTAVPGALKEYDLCDLVAEGKLLILNEKDTSASAASVFGDDGFLE